VNAWAGAALAIWLGLAAASAVVWVTQLGGIRPLNVRPVWLALLLGGEVSLTALVAWLSAISGPAHPTLVLDGRWGWRDRGRAVRQRDRAVGLRPD
jgi:hypothetical protein